MRLSLNPIGPGLRETNLDQAIKLQGPIGQAAPIEPEVRIILGAPTPQGNTGLLTAVAALIELPAVHPGT